MEAEHHHKILVVDDDEQVQKALGRYLKAEKIEAVHADSEKAGLAELKKTSFSVIISDQLLGSDRGGILFLEQAKQIAPDSIRFLMTACSEMETIIDAVNKGSIQRYIVKPWKPDDLFLAITSGFKLYESFLDNRNLLNTAKNQNAKLYELNCEFMEKTKSQNRRICELDAEIESIEREANLLCPLPPVDQELLLLEIENSLKDDTGIHSEKIQTLFSNTIRRLHDQLNASARQSGFDLPEWEGELK